MADPDYRHLRYSLEDGVATVTLDRPETLNAMNNRMAAELLEVIDRTDGDDAVKAVIFTGAGRGFCSGADLSAGADMFNFAARDDTIARPAGSEVHRDVGGIITLRLFDSLKPVIAAVNGVAAGIGATMQLAMDVRMASANARYGFVFAQRGIHLEAASSWFLPRLVGLQTALEWCFTGRLVSAEDACAAGLVRSVHAGEDLLPAARALAREIVDNAAPVSVALTRRLLWRMAGAPHPMEAHRIESRGIEARGKQGDAQEGVRAFLEKRAPAFADRVSADLPEIWSTWTDPAFH